MQTRVAYEDTLIEEGPAIWRRAIASRLAPIMENDQYFRALDAALAKAEKSVVVLGWQFDPRTRLDPQSPTDARKFEIGERLKSMVRARPDLKVRLLIWRSPLVIAASQDFYPHKALKWFNQPVVDLELDGVGILGACHHQKVVVIDDKVAFVGGGDISVDRWDSEGHYSGDPRRCMPSGLIPSPRHEWMCVVDGEAARALGDLARRRWKLACGEDLPEVETEGDPWPDTVRARFYDIPVGLSRTEPEARGQPEVRENETLFIESIKRAKHLIYIENQYFTSPFIASAIAARLEEEDGPEVVLVSTGRSPSWFDGLTMDTARAEVLWRLEKADKHDRFFAFYPLTSRGDRIIVHAKMCIIDDKLMRIGSTNINNRSMGLDTEVDLCFEARSEAERDAVREYRQHTLGHFIGVSSAEFDQAESIMGSVGRAIETFGQGRMNIMGLRQPTRLERMFAEWQFGDPLSAKDAWKPWRRRYLTRMTRPRSEGGQSAG